MISILMATYNGELYLSQQIESVLSQTISDFHIYINDDHSTDRTWEIISEYAERYPQKISATRSERNSGSAKLNFLAMMLRIHSDYSMLCDQDDIWLPRKIELTLAEMKRLEAQKGQDHPILVHTDLCVVDAQLKVINPSFKEAMHADYSKTALYQQIIQNTLTGCTAMYNRALAELLREPQSCVMHDWWLILVAAAFGTIGPIEQKTILYRQHGNNEVGAKDVRTVRYKLDHLMHKEEIVKAIQGTYLQAGSLLQQYEKQLSPEQKKLLQEYCGIPRQGKLRRWQTIFRLHSFKNGLARNFAYLWFV